jgi:hypothetical protein
VAFVEAEASRKSVGDLEIDPESAEIVRLIFELALKHYGNLSAVRCELKDYRTKHGNRFSFNALKLIVTYQIWAGLVQYSAAEAPVHRPDLQIIPKTRQVIQ